MRHLLCLLSLMLIPLPAAADVTLAPAAASSSAVIPWAYQLKDAVVHETGPDGQAKNSLDLGVVDSFLQIIARYADSYPPRFDNAAERRDATDKLTRLIEVLAALDTGSTVSVDLLRREAFAYNLGCNLDLPNSCAKTMDVYTRLLKMTPDEPAANYLYGVFLAGLPPKQREAIPYLKKSLTLGVKRANYSLGMLYLALRDKQKALSYMQVYSADFPDDQNAKQIIADIKSGNKSVPAPATH
jgi:TPR repeat protein